MKFIETDIEGLVIVEPKVFFDSRGYFFEQYNKEKFDEYFGDTNFIQDNNQNLVKVF